MRHQPRTSAAIFLVVMVSSALLAAQTKVTPPQNKYTPAQDVRLGAEAADEAERQLPVMKDDAVTSYIERIGEQLAGAIPNELRHTEFRYTFKVVNVREINAFALPGGPMFVNRGMLEAAKNEGEVAGVMAHEISHVVLRHGTAQASKASKYEGLAVAGTVVGAILGCGLGRVVSASTRFGVGGVFLKFGRDFERQADIEGAQIMARAGYDPRDMANFFRTIQQQVGSNGPEWLSDHPDPGNRYDTIIKEAQSLQVEHPFAVDARAFESCRPICSAAARPDECRGEPFGVRSDNRRGRRAALRPRRTAFGSLDAVFEPSLPSERAVELAAAPRFELGRLRPRGRLRRGERTDRLHARCPDRHCSQSEPRLADCHREPDRPVLAKKCRTAPHGGHSPAHRRRASRVAHDLVEPLGSHRTAGNDRGLHDALRDRACSICSPSRRLTHSPTTRARSIVSSRLCDSTTRSISPARAL